MNERIKELAEQSTTIEYGVDNGFDRVTFDKEKFAKLIVQDVLTIMDNPVNYNQCVYTTFDADRAKCAAQELSKKIKEYFKDTQ